MHKDKTSNEKLVYNDALEYSAKLIKTEASLYQSEDVKEFADNIVISIRAVKFQIDILK